MDTKKITVFIDTNIFVIDLRYKDDVNFKINRSFLDLIAVKGRGVISIINLLELCGILSFNLNQRQITELFHYFPLRYTIDVIPSNSIDSPFPETAIKDIMELIYKKASFGDALIANVINSYLKENSIFVSWDAVHFKHLLSIKTMTPKEFLSAIQR